MNRPTVTGARHGSGGGTGMNTTEDAPCAEAGRSGMALPRRTATGRRRHGPPARDRAAPHPTPAKAVIARRRAAALEATGAAIPPGTADPDPPPDA